MSSQTLPSRYGRSQHPEILIMVRIGERPLWKRILYLECIALEFKRDVMVEGYAVVLLALTSPIWCWVFLPKGCELAKEWLAHRYEVRRQAPYGGINIAENNTARPMNGWWRRRRSLSRVPSTWREAVKSPLLTLPRGASREDPVSPLLRLPSELRRQIWLYLVRPADEVTICAIGREKRLVTIRTEAWLDAYNDPRRFDRSDRGALPQFLGSTRTQEPEKGAYICRDMLNLAKVNRSMYREIIPLLYSENIFNFHPHQEPGRKGSFEHFLAFTHSIPAARLQDLRHIRLLVNFDFCYVTKKQEYFLRGSGEARWKQACDTLKQMSGLLTLNIEVTRVGYQTRTTHWNRRWPVEGLQPESRLVRLLVGVRAKKACLVVTPWVKSVIGELEGAEFELVEGKDALDVVDKSLLSGR